GAVTGLRRNPDMLSSRWTDAWRSCRILLLSCVALVSLAQPLSAEQSTFRNDVVQFTASIDQRQVAPGSVIKLTIKCSPAAGYHTYPIKQQESSAESLTLKFGKSDA